MSIFSKLSKEEIEILHETPALVTILVGAADGKLDGEERTWSERLLHARTYSGKQELQDYYRSVSEGFWAALQHKMSVLPTEVEARNTLLSDRLESLNPIFEKLDPAIAYALYKGLLGLAEEVGKASGGFLRIGAVSASEHLWVKLPMLTPVEAPGVSDEAEDEALEG